MQTWSDMERREAAIKKQLEKKDIECVSCPTCSSQWFEEVNVSRYKADHNLVLGQHVPTKPSTIPYILLRCLNCKDCLEPRVMHNTRDVVGGDYNNFLDTLEGKNDSREENKPVEKSNEIKSQEL